MAPWVKTVLYVLLALVFLGLAGYIWLLRRNRQAEAARWKRLADQKYKEGRNEASQILRSAVDQISDDKARMASLSDRELMTEALLALSGLGRRMDRIEDSIRLFSQFDDLTQSLTQQADEISQNAALLSQQVTQAQNAAASFQSAVADTGEAVYSLSDSTHSMEGLLQDVSRQLQETDALKTRFSELQDQMDTVLDRMNRTLKVSAENPAAAISQMDGRISAVYNQLQNLSEGLNLMAESLEGVQDTLDRVHSHCIVVLCGII